MSTVFQVDRRSSLAKMSPATMLVSRGKPAIPANPSTTKGSANPDEVIHRPKSVSAGVEVCDRMMSAKTNGPSRHTIAARRGRSCAETLASSTR